MSASQPVVLPPASQFRGTTPVTFPSVDTFNPSCISNSSLRTELVGKDSLNEADASALVEEVFQDTDLAKFFDEEFQVRFAVNRG